MTRRWAFLLLGGWLGLGCIPEDAGYGDVRKLVRDRTGHDVPWRKDDQDGDARTRELLREPLTAERAVELTLTNNPEVQTALEDLGIARADAVRAAAIPNPTAEVGVKLGGDHGARWDVAVTQDVVGLLFLPSAHGAARAELDAKKLSVGGRVLDIVLETRRAYLKLQAAEQALKLRRTVLLAAKAASDAAAALHDAGNVTDLDYANQRALFDEARLGVADSESELVFLREKLRAQLGLWGEGGNFRVVPTLGEPDEGPLDALTLERTALERSVDLAMARQRYTAAAKRANLSRVRGFLPELKAGASAERDAGKWAVGPLVEVEIPLFYQGQGEVGRARAEMRKEQRQHQTLAVQIRAAVRAATTRALAARQRAHYYTATLVPLRKRIVDETELHYNAMNAGVFQLLQAKREHVEAERSRILAVRDYWLAKIELQQLAAGRLTSGESSVSTSDPAREHATGAGTAEGPGE